MSFSQEITMIQSPEELGQMVRAQRKKTGSSLRDTSASSRLGVRFLSEFERGKPTAEIGKVMEALHAAGLDLAVVPRTPLPTSNKQTIGLDRLSQKLNLEFPYDWSNSQLNESTFIQHVLRKSRFNDVLRIVNHFGLSRVESEAALFVDTPQGTFITKLLNHIRIGIERAKKRK